MNNFDLSSPVLKHLTASETIYWKGRPNKGFTPYGLGVALWAIMLVVPGLFLLVFVVMNFVLVASLLIRTIFGLPLTAVCIYALMTLFINGAFCGAWRHKSTYFITNTRVFIMHRWPAQRTGICYQYLNKLNDIQLIEERGDKSGTIVFDQWYPFSRVLPPWSRIGFTWGWCPAFVNIANAAKVCDLLMHLRRDSIRFSGG